MQWLATGEQSLSRYYNTSLALMRWHYGHIEALQNPNSLFQRSNNNKASQDVFVLVVLASQ